MTVSIAIANAIAIAITVKVQSTICNSLLFYRELAKFRQNRMIRTTHNFDLFDKQICLQ